jgi:hypothetical protein
MLAATMVIGGLALAPTAAQASVQGRENTAIALGLGTIYALSQHKDGAAAVLGIGTVVATQQYEQARQDQYCAPGYDNRSWNGDRHDGVRFYRSDPRGFDRDGDRR